MIHGHIEGVIEVMDQVVERLAVAPNPGGNHAVWSKSTSCDAATQFKRLKLRW